MKLDIRGISSGDIFSHKEVRDVSMLGGVRELHLTSCRSITSGFECLGGVHSLNLGNCTKLRDEHISNLGTVSVLNLSESEYHECESFRRSDGTPPK